MYKDLTLAKLTLFKDCTPATSLTLGYCYSDIKYLHGFSTLRRQNRLVLKQLGASDFAKLSWHRHCRINSNRLKGQKGAIR